MASQPQHEQGDIPSIPSDLKHIAIIMDGNGRWATKRHRLRLAGHQAGLEAVRKIVEHAVKCNLPALTLFAFSSENWSRPEYEVKGLVRLFTSVLENEIAKIHEQNIQLRFIGGRERFGKRLAKYMDDAERLTWENTGLKLRIAANYGGRWDVLQATQQIAKAAASGLIKPEDIDESCFAAYLSLADVPEPDLFIRTSGEKRLSNFLLWQLAYTELYFTDTLWPDFSPSELNKAIFAFSERHRRYGKTEEQFE